MFEEEETFRKNYPEYICGKELLSPYWDLWQDGAEYGYKLAHEEMDYLNQHWKDNKANEWHYCKDELPDHNGQFYVALKGHTETFICNYDYDEDDESKMVWIDDDYNICDDEVYAWCEKLKAPKEID